MSPHLPKALLDRMWNGRHAGSSVELPENISMTALLWRATMPLTNPHYTAKARSLYQKKTQDEASKKANACLEGDVGRCASREEVWGDMGRFE